MIKHTLISIRMKFVLKANYVLKYAAEDRFSMTEPKNTYEIRQVSISFEIPFPMSSSFPHFSLLKLSFSGFPKTWRWCFLQLC